MIKESEQLITKNNYISLIWWKIMFTISIINIIFIINYYKNYCCNSEFHKKITLFTIIYVFVAAIRAFFPVIHIERICFIKNIISSPFVDRSIATIAEICFILLITSILKNIINNTTKSQNQILILTLLNYSIICAQIFCWLGSLTQNYFFNVMEESTWTICFIIILIILFKLYIFASNNSNAQNNFLKKTLPLIIIPLILYLLFMIINDVPLYFKRWKNNKNKYINIINGINKMLKCRKIDKSYKTWKDDYLWIFGYFSFAVWLSIYFVIWYTKYNKLKLT
jgi:hypothetical protein